MIRTVYVYVVLFATLMMTIGGSVAAFMAIADYVSPNPYYQSYEDFKRMKENQQMGPQKPGEEDRQVPDLDESELRIEYDQMVEHEKKRQKQRAMNSLIKSLGWIVIPLPVFVYYQRRLKELNQSKE